MMKKPSKRLKTKIFRPFLLVVLVLSALVFLAFNVSMRIYMNRVAFNEIATSRETINVHLRNELRTVNANGTPAQDVVLAINRSFRLSVATTGTEMAILGANGELILPRTADLSPDMLAAVKTVESKLLAGEMNDTFNMRMNGIDYLVSFGKYNNAPIRARAQTLVLMASKESATMLIRRTNFMLILILSLSSLIGLAISNRLAEDVTRPIRSVSQYARQLTKGHYEKMNFQADTEEIHSLYENLNNMGEALKTKEKMKIDLIQNFSHDLRTPLMSIQGYAEGIKTGVFDDTAKAAGVIAEESIRLTHLVDQLITLSKLDLPEKHHEWVHLDLCQFLGLMIDRHEGYATKEHKKITLECPKGIKLFTREELLEKVLANLLGNAIRYAHSTVRIMVSLVDGQAKIALSDDGPGIPEDLMPHLFNRFAKGEKGQFGLGLSIAHAAAEQIDGRLEVENTQHGAVFTLFHPFIHDPHGSG